jgi:hypothetical protein
MADDALRGDLANATDPTKGATLVGYNTYQTVREHLSDIVTFEQFGAGSTPQENDAALVRLITYLNDKGGNCTVQVNGLYKFTEACPVPLTVGNVYFVGRGIFDLSDLPTATLYNFIEVSGPGFTGAQSTVTAPWVSTRGAGNVGENLVLKVADSTGFGRGDWVTVTSTEYYTGAAKVSGFRIVGRGRLRRVQAIVDATTLALDEESGQDFDTANHTVTARGLRMIENIGLDGFTIIGPSPNILSNAGSYTGPRFLGGKYIHNYYEKNLTVRNFQTSATLLTLCDHLTFTSSSYKSVYTGSSSLSCRNATWSDIDFNRGRRPQNWDDAFRPFAGVSTIEEVQSEHMTILGGLTRNAVGIGGHVCHRATLLATRVYSCEGAINQRGMHLKIVGCDFDTLNGCVTLGVGASIMEDNSSYAEDPSCGDIYIDETTTMSAQSGPCINAMVGWDSFHCTATLKGPGGLAAFGKHLSNVYIVPRFIAVGSTPAAYNIGAGPSQPLDASNIRFESGRIEGAERAIWHKGARNSIVSNFYVDGVQFVDCPIHYVRCDTPANMDRLTCHVRDCVYHGTLASAPVGGSFSDAQTSLRNAFQLHNNTFGVELYNPRIASGAITYVSNKAHETLVVAATDGSEVSSINGSIGGYVTLIFTVSGATINATNSIRLSAPFSNVPANSSITFWRSGSGNFFEISRAVMPGPQTAQ